MWGEQTIFIKQEKKKNIFAGNINFQITLVQIVRKAMNEVGNRTTNKENSMEHNNL